MKMNRRLSLGIVGLTIAAAGFAVVPGSLHAAGAAQAPPARGGMPNMPPGGMAEMMKMHEQMMAEMKASGAKLDALAKEMNAATGTAKVNAIAAVVNELVTQHKGMQAHMEGMGQQMMMGGRGGMMIGGREGMPPR